ncbi:transposase [Streptomyces syringium]|uniref:transposase n=1 Tax=Streptomyces syringium TaxID=76729 RepID=UPI0037CE5690
MVDHDVVIRRHELTDLEWELLAPLIPSAGRGRPRAEDRRIANGMVYKIRTGVSWRSAGDRPSAQRPVRDGFPTARGGVMFPDRLADVTGTSPEAWAYRRYVARLPDPLPLCGRAGQSTPSYLRRRGRQRGPGGPHSAVRTAWPACSRFATSVRKGDDRSAGVCPSRPQVRSRGKPLPSDAQPLMQRAAVQAPGS